MCDLICMSTTVKEVRIKVPRARSKADEASSHFIYKTPSSITMNAKVDDPTPMQRMRNRGLKKARNDAFISERDEFFGRLREEKEAKHMVEYESAEMIQAAYRGFRLRGQRGLRPETVEVVSQSRRFARQPPSSSDLNNELCKWQTMLELKPIPGLTLAAHGQNVKRQQRFEYAAAIRIQCFFRMIYAKLIVMAKRRKMNNRRQFEAAVTITKAVEFMVERMRKKQMQEFYKHHAAIQIQNTFRIFAARRFVRKVNRMKRHVLRTNDAAVRMQRSFRTMMEYKKGMASLAALVVDGDRPNFL